MASDVEEYLAMAARLAGEGDLGGALDAFTAALERDPTAFAGLLGRGLLRRELGDLEGALTDLDAALDLNDESPHRAHGARARAPRARRP